jgi:hypothetical protein
MDGGVGNVANAASGAAKTIAWSFEIARKNSKHDGACQKKLRVVRKGLCVLKQRGGMRRSGALTLGAVLMLAGATGGRGDELSSSLSSSGFALPAIPENWADLPVRLTASESVSYNSNIFSVPTNTILPNDEPRGDFTSTSSYGLSTRANWEGQQFFFDGSFGVIRYLHQVQFNSNIYSFNPGVNWILTSRCAGTVAGLLTKSQSLITELVGVGINYSTTTSANETGKCAVSNGYSVIFNSGVTDVTNSNTVDAVNNAHTEMLAAGIEYAKGYSDLTALATVSDTNYSNRTAAQTAVGLANTIVYHNFDLTYARQINPNLSVTGKIGLVGVTNDFSLGLPKTLLPIYSLALAWTITPKVTLAATVSRTVTPPITVIANAEVAYQANMNLTYQATPKVAFTASASAGYSSAAFTPALAGTIFAPFFTVTDYYSAQAAVTYSMTPFLTAALTAVYVERVGDHLITPQDLITVSLNYKPY